MKHGKLKQNKYGNYRRKRRFLASFLCACMLFTMPGMSDIFPVFAAEEQEESVTADNVIIDFCSLPEEVKEQTVSVGTDLEELNLPEELTVCLAREPETFEQDTQPEDDELENTEPEDGQENTETEITEPEIGDGQENTEQENVEAENTDTETEDGQDPQPEESESPEESDKADETGGTDTETLTDDEDIADSEKKENDNAENVEGQEQQPEEAAVTQETHTVTMPEYQTENTIPVETLENTQDTETGKATDPKKDEESEEILETEKAEKSGESEKVTETVTISGVMWESEPTYDGDIAGVYLFTPVLPEDYLLAEGVSLPKIKVTVMGKEKGIWESDIEIELLEPDWDDPFVEEYNITAVLAVPGEWDSYDWQVFAGPYAENEEEPWVSGTEFGMEELISDGKLSLDKEMLMTYAFRCVVERDGELFTTIPYAEDEEALTAPLYHIMTMGDGDFQSGENIWMQSSYMAVAKPGYNDRGFDVYGVKKKGGFYKTTYGNFGYCIVSEVNGRKLKWRPTPKTNLSIGSSLVGRFDYDIVYSGRYAKITYTIENTGSTVQSFHVGSSADVMIDKNDKAPITGTSMGLQMNDGKGKTFNLVVPDADTTWFGYFYDAYKEVFTDLPDKSTPYKGDSGMAWSWSGSVAPGEVWERSALIGIGEMPTPPSTPIIEIAVDGNRSYVIPKEEITVSGTATAGTTVHIMAGGTEYETAVGGDGGFSTKITIPADAKEHIDIICWAVSGEGGISNTVTKRLTVSNEPRISLTDSTATVAEGDNLDDAWYQNFIKTTVGTISHTTISTNTPGTYDVTYTAKVTGFSDAEAVLKVTVLAHPLEIAPPQRQKAITQVNLISPPS